VEQVCDRPSGVIAVQGDVVELLEDMPLSSPAGQIVTARLAEGFRGRYRQRRN
jgi:hypothetical protein